MLDDLNQFFPLVGDDPAFLRRTEFPSRRSALVDRTVNDDLRAIDIGPEGFGTFIGQDQADGGFARTAVRDLSSYRC